MKRAILHIPHSEMMAMRPIKHWIEHFETMTRARATEIVLPGVDLLGPTFDSRVCSYSARLKSGNLLPNWIQQIRQQLGNGVPIWVSIIPQYPFLKVENVMVQDQYGAHIRQVCITNPTVQKITDVFLTEIAEFGITGVAFDLTDAYPNSTSDAYEGLQNTCFCNHCLKQLAQAGWREGDSPFIGEKNLTRFVLHKTPTGASNIEALHEWIENQDWKSLAQIAIARGFVESDDALEDAAKLLRYLGARGLVTANAVRRLGQVAQKNKMSVAAILGEDSYNMTQGTDVPLLAQAEAATEYWLPTISSEFVQSKGVQAIQYLSGRSTYSFNYLFETIGNADDTIAGSGVEKFIEILLYTSKRTKNKKLNPAAVFSVELGDEYAGYIGIPISQADIEQIIADLLKRGTLGAVVPRDVINDIIQQVRLASSEGTTLAD